MFAIELTEENFEKIRSRGGLVATEEPFVKLFVNPVNRRCLKYYFINGYTNLRGVQEAWALLPDFVFEKTFDYDPDKIKTDWDIIVRL